MSIEEEFFKMFGIEPTYSDECQIADAYYSMQNDLNERGILYDDYMKGEGPQKNTFCYDDCPYAYNKEQYPPITDRILLELICILNRHYSEHYQIASMIVGKNIEEVKRSILNDCIEQCNHKDFKVQVQLLFKGGAE